MRSTSASVRETETRPFAWVRGTPVAAVGMKTIALATGTMILAALLAGCAPLTPEQQAALEAQQEQYARECQLRGGLFMSGSCVSRSGGQ